MFVLDVFHSNHPPITATQLTSFNQTASPEYIWASFLNKGIVLDACVLKEFLNVSSVVYCLNTFLPLSAGVCSNQLLMIMA